MRDEVDTKARRERHGDLVGAEQEEHVGSPGLPHRSSGGVEAALHARSESRPPKRERRVEDDERSSLPSPRKVADKIGRPRRDAGATGAITRLAMRSAGDGRPAALGHSPSPSISRASESRYGAECRSRSEVHG